MAIKKCRAAVLEAVKTITIKEFPIPETKNDDALLRLEAVGVCGSDIGMYSGKTKRIQQYFPIILGHEIVGHIEKAGDDFCRRHNVQRGDRVIVEYTFGCGFCKSCLSGNYRLCERKGRYGSYISCNTAPHLWGGYSEYLYLPPTAMVHKITPTVPAEAAVVATAVLGNAIRWLRQIGGVSIGDTVVIEGPGPQGLAAIIAARESGADRIIVTGTSRDGSRLDMARSLGADHIVVVDQEDPVARVSDLTGGEMADAVIDVTGIGKGAQLALDLLKQGGTFVMPGTYGTDTEVPLFLDKIVLKEIKIIGAYSHDMRSVEPAVKLVEAGKYRLEKMVTHRFKLEQADLAVRTVGGMIPGELPVKAIIEFDR